MSVTTIYEGERERENLLSYSESDLAMRPIYSYGKQLYHACGAYVDVELALIMEPSASPHEVLRSWV